MAGPWEIAGRTRRQRIADSYAFFVAPRPSGLPNWKVVTWFPALVGFLGTLLISFGISGTSSGSHWANFGTGDDPRLLLGGPRPIRSDEWLVSQSWISSQAQQGFPAQNHTLPGGMDATVLNELPNWDWSTLFRPHEWGFLFFGLDIGTAWQWWLPAIGLVVGAYLLMVTLMPKRSITAAVVATAVFFSPIYQWWFGANSLWPAAWSLLAMAGTLWILRDRRRWVRIVWSVLLGWLGVTTVIGLYVPFMLTPLLVFVFFFIGAVLQERPWSRESAKRVFGRLAPLLIAGALAGVVVLTWVRTRIGTFDAIQATIYPGARSDPSGQLLTQDPTLAGIAGAPWGQSFRTGATILGPNPSEAATAILLAVFLVPALIWFLVRRIRDDRRADWLIVGALVGTLLILAFLLIPGWDPIARLFLLDRVPVSRFRGGFAMMIPLFFALVAREIDRSPSRRNWPIAIVCAVVAIALFVIPLWSIITLDPGALQTAPLWPLTEAAILASVILIFWRRTIPWAAASLLVASLTIGAAVNPFYQGVFHLNDTRIGKKIAQVESADPGVWVGVGSYETMALMMASGVEAFNGVQPYPPKEMWKEIDPTGAQEEVWNRLAHVRWTWGPGEPQLSAPYRDSIQSTFDACSAFGQKHVDYVLSDEKPPSLGCLEEIASIRQGKSDMQIYRVLPEHRPGPSAG